MLIVEHGKMMQALHPPQNFKCLPFWNGQSYGIKNLGAKVVFNGIICLPNFRKIHPSVQQLLGGTHKQMHRSYKPPFIFLMQVG
jgi:hypothetical protein